MMHIVKLYPTHDGQSFSAFGRIYSGTVKPGDTVQVLGEGYSPDEDCEDVTISTVSAVSIPRGRRRTAVNMAIAGNWVLLDGIDSTIAKTATITSSKNTLQDHSRDPVYIFHPLRFPQVSPLLCFIHIHRFHYIFIDSRDFKIGGRGICDEAFNGTLESSRLT
jgi:U5 small nuclear ribonucleoprotein component